MKTKTNRFYLGILKQLKKPTSHWIIILALGLAYLILRSDNYVGYLLPEAANDDGLHVKIAMSITQGQWLGAYDSLILSKGLVYPLWLAFLHLLDVPLWMGESALYLAACLTLIYAVRRLFKNRWILPLIFAFLLFNPMFVERVIRDAIAPSLMLFLMAWVIGIAVTFYAYGKDEPIFKRELFMYTFVGALSLPGWWFLREDSFWVLLFIGAILISVVCLILLSKNYGFVGKSIKSKSFYTLIIIVPFLTTSMTGLILASQNYKYYGRFVVNDYTSDEFESAYGALSRIHNTNWRPTVPISESMRKAAYSVSPAFAELQSCLDNIGDGRCEGWKQHGEHSDDYDGGWFFWALRQAVADKGYYRDPSTAAAYYKRLALEINNACETKLLKCDYSARSTLAPPFRTEYVPYVINNLEASVGYLAMLTDADMLKPPRVSGFDEDKEHMANYVAVKYQAEELNYGARAKIKVQKIIAVSYAYAQPILISISLSLLLFTSGCLTVKKIRTKVPMEIIFLIMLAWLILITLVIPRLLMLSYVSASSFPAITYQYYSSLYVATFVFEALILGGFIEYLRSQYRQRRN